ncbi:MAG: NAD-dependent epimerase/dehydratase family protein [Anaerolineae bacterium]|nr:NAD-dependent epimerase/dehydratase family protein [Anaerolineae bacterium]
MKVLVTGANGFIGRNLTTWLERLSDVQLLPFDRAHSSADLVELAATADLVYHLAGVNRPPSVEEFRTGNVDLTVALCEALQRTGRPIPVVFASSIQAELDNPYGLSKREAEAVLADYAGRAGAAVAIFRLSNVFGKWCRPNYNSVVATFCYNIARGLPITISDPSREVRLVHVDDVVRAFLEVLSEVEVQKLEVRSQQSAISDRKLQATGHRVPIAVERSPFTVHRSPTTDHWSPITDHQIVSYYEARPIYTVTLGRLAELIRSFRESRQSLLAPDFNDPFVYKLYGTYLSYLPEDDFAYDLVQRTDPRGALAEFIKSPGFGQIFVSRTQPGITRGNHFHHVKAEKFLVLEGEAVIRFRPISGQKSEVRGQGSEIIEYRVSGRDFRVVDIPPGYTHSITNVGDTELVTLFWASEVFDPQRPDTWYEEV